MGNPIIPQLHIERVWYPYFSSLIDVFVLCVIVDVIGTTFAIHVQADQVGGPDRY